MHANMPSGVRPHVRAAVAVAFALGLTAPVRAQTHAGQIADPSELLTGQSAQGAVGDWVLENDVLRVIVDDIPHAHGFADTGGNIIDAARLGADDRFASLF